MFVAVAYRRVGLISIITQPLSHLVVDGTHHTNSIIYSFRIGIITEMSSTGNTNFRSSNRLPRPTVVDGGDGFCHCFYCELTDLLSRLIIDDNHNSQPMI